MRTVTLVSSIPSTSSPFPPNLPFPHHRNLSPHSQLHSPTPPSPPPPPPTPPLPASKLAVSRRNAALSLSVAALVPLTWLTPPSALAFDIGISGPKEWLKEQKKKSIKYILAPIVASREILTYALQKLKKDDSSLEQKDMEEFRGMLNSAARDCVSGDRSSLVAFQAQTGVEVCTFKLLVSNASSLLNDNDPSKLVAEASLEDLIRSFTLLNGVAKEADLQINLDRRKVEDALVGTLSSLNQFEQGIKGCIQV